MALSCEQLKSLVQKMEAKRDQLRAQWSCLSPKQHDQDTILYLKGELDGYNWALETLKNEMYQNRYWE